MNLELETRTRRWLSRRMIHDRKRVLVIHMRAQAVLDLGASALLPVSWKAWLADDSKPQLAGLDEHVDRTSTTRLVRIVENLAEGKPYVDADGVVWDGCVRSPSDPRLAVIGKLADFAGVREADIDKEAARRQMSIERLLSTALQDLRGQFDRANKDAVPRIPSSRRLKRERRETVVVRGRRLAATPSARRLAREAGISLDSVRGSGRRGRIGKSDVLDLLERRDVRHADRQAQVEDAAMPPGDQPFEDFFVPAGEPPPFEPADEVPFDDLADEAFEGLDAVFREAELESVRKALSGVARVAGRFDHRVIADLLAGVRTGCLDHAGLSDTKTFGALRGKPRSWIVEVLRLCEVNGLVDRGELTRQGRSVMVDADPVAFRLPDPTQDETT